MGGVESVWCVSRVGVGRRVRQREERRGWEGGGREGGGRGRKPLHGYPAVARTHSSCTWRVQSQQSGPAPPLDPPLPAPPREPPPSLHTAVKRPPVSNAPSVCWRSASRRARDHIACDLKISAVKFEMCTSDASNRVSHDQLTKNQ